MELDIKDFKIRLDDHKGVQDTPYGQVTATLPQKVIFVNGVWAGYVSTVPGSHISLIAGNIPVEVVEHIKSEVDRQLGWSTSLVCQAQHLEENDIRVEPAPVESAPENPI